MTARDLFRTLFELITYDLRGLDHLLNHSRTVPPVLKWIRGTRAEVNQDISSEIKVGLELTS
jgi:hypothetical protein